MTNTFQEQELAGGVLSYLQSIGHHGKTLEIPADLKRAHDQICIDIFRLSQRAAEQPLTAEDTRHVAELLVELGTIITQSKVVR